MKTELHPHTYIIMIFTAKWKQILKLHDSMQNDLWVSCADKITYVNRTFSQVISAK